jgi:4-hydroxy-2-oxoheptanedioate aldolase
VKLPANPFKRALREGRAQIGLWIGFNDPAATEICAGANFDWLLLDAEHAPKDPGSLLVQLQALAAYRSHPVVRPWSGEAHLVKRLLDIGAQTLLVPMVETAAQATELVRAMHYPPRGVRGVGSALARASRWTRVPDYLRNAGEELCLLVQVESATAVRNAADIAAVDGVDGVFIGPSDLAASLGHIGQPAHPEVRAAIESAIREVSRQGKAPGILATDPALARQYLDLGCRFVAVGIDTVLLAGATGRLARDFGMPPPDPAL